jgi:hypothetical protein
LARKAAKVTRQSGLLAIVQVLMAKQQKAVGVQQSPELSDQLVGQRLGDIEPFDGQAQLGL